MDKQERGSLDMVTSPCVKCATESPIDTAKNIINWGLLCILLIGLILGTYLIYRKHKGEKGLWKRFLKWNAIFLLIIFVLWIGFSFVFWYIMGPFADPQTISFEN